MAGYSDAELELLKADPESDCVERFAPRPADGTIGGHANAVQACYRDFRALARKIAE